MTVECEGNERECDFGGGTYLNEVDTSTSYAPHEGLQGNPAVITIDGDLVSQSRITSPLTNIQNQRHAPSDAVDGTYDYPHVKISSAISVQSPWTVGLVTRNADVVESLRKADTRPVGALGFELQVHEATEAVQEWSRGAGPVKGGGTTETTGSPAGSRVATGVARIIVVFLVVDWERGCV